MMNNFGNTVNNIPSICSTQKCKVWQQEVFCNAKLTRNCEREITKLFSVSRGHNLDWNTLWVSVGDVHTHELELSQEKCPGWTMRFLQCRQGCPHQPSPWDTACPHTAEVPLGCQDLGRLTQARLCAAMTCTVWRSGLLPGQHQGCTVTGTRASWVCPSSVPWWVWVVALIMAH